MLIMAVANSHAQQRQVDSLKRLLLTAREDTAKADILLQFCRYWLGSKPDSAELMVQQGLDLSRQLGYLAGEASGLNLMGLVHSAKGNYPKALNHYLEALKINERRNDRLGMAKNLGNIAGIYWMQGDHRRNIDHLLKTKALLESIANEEVLTATLTNLGGGYQDIGMLDSARLYTNQALELAIRLKDLYNMSNNTNNLAFIYREMGQRDIALAYARSAAGYFRQDHNDEGLCGNQLFMAETFRDMNQPDSSLYYARQGFAIASNLGFPYLIAEAGKLLTERFKEEGKPDSALHYLELYMAAKDTLFSQEKVKEIQALSFAEQQRQEEMAEQQRLEQHEKRKNIQMAGIAIFIPVFFLFALYLSRTSVKPRTVGFLSLVILLLLFEFISMLISPLVGYVEHLTTNSPVINMLIHIGVASLLVPVRKPIDRWVKGKLRRRNDTDPITVGTAVG